MVFLRNYFRQTMEFALFSERPSFYNTRKVIRPDNPRQLSGWKLSDIINEKDGDERIDIVSGDNHMLQLFDSAWPNGITG